MFSSAPNRLKFDVKGVYSIPTIPIPYYDKISTTYPSFIALQSVRTRVRLAESFIHRSIPIRIGIKMKKSIMAEMASAPPPPPPLSKGSRKTLIAVIVIVAIAAVAVGVYLATQSGGGGGGGATTGVAGASSLQFSISVTQGGVSQGTYKYMAKNIGTSSMMIRVEITSADGDLIYIVNGAQQKAWGYSGGEWIDLSDTFSDQWDAWNSTWAGYKESLFDWTGTGDWTYTDPDGNSVRVYDIAVNPSLADSLFEHS
jgi:hypothetical protein